VRVQDAEAFVAARRPRWEALSDRLQAGGSMDAADWSSLAADWRALCADLAEARHVDLPEDVARWLDDLAARAHDRLYAGRNRVSGRWLAWVRDEIPREVRASWGVVLAAHVLFYVPAIGAAIAGWQAPELAEALQRELEALRESDEEKAAYLPLQVKWTAIMSSIVLVALAISAQLVFLAQSSALKQQAIDSGVSLSKFVAVQAAIPVLSEDWVTLDSFVQDAVGRESFQYLVVSDHAQVVRVSSNAALVDQPRPSYDAGEIIYSQDDVVVTDVGEVFDFSLPSLFNETVVGGVNVGLDTTQLESAFATTQQALGVLVLLVVIAVAAVLYVFNQIIAKNLKLIKSAVQLYGRGQLETRISKQRSDEFGDLFNAFNTMADSLEERVHTGTGSDDPDPDPLTETQLREIDVSGITIAAVDEQTIVEPEDKPDNA